MAQQTINLGAAPDDGTGDTLRVGGDKINDNFTELYTADAALGTASALDVDIDDTLAADSDSLIPTQQAVKAYVDANIGSPITELDDVPDVNAPAPSNGEVLTWDSTPGEWVSQALPGAGAFVIGDATDVDTTGAASGNVLTYDGAQWEPVAPSGTPLSSLYEDQKAANTAGGTVTSGAWGGHILNTELHDEIGLALRASTFTVTIATPGLFTWTAHGLVAGSVLIFTTSGALPTGLTAGTPYYVIAAGLTANDFEVSATLGGAAVNTSGSQSGTHTATSSTISLAAGDYETRGTASFFVTNSCRARLRDITNGVTLALSTSVYAPAANNANGYPTFEGYFTLAGTAIVQLEYRVETTRASDGLGVAENFGEVEVYARLKLIKLS